MLYNNTFISSIHIPSMLLQKYWLASLPVAEPSLFKNRLAEARTPALVKGRQSRHQSKVFAGCEDNYNALPIATSVMRSSFPFLRKVVIMLAIISPLVSLSGHYFKQSMPSLLFSDNYS